MNILLVDDDQASRTAIAQFLEDLGHVVIEKKNGKEALECFNSGNFAMVLSDIKMPLSSGMELLRAIKTSTIGQYSDVVLYTGYGDMDSAIGALRAGAYDYLLKPVNVEELALVTEKVAEHQALLRENRLLTDKFDDVINSANNETKKELARVKKIATQCLGLGNVGFFSKDTGSIVSEAQRYHLDRTIPVLLEGETGTGKEVFARIIHFGAEPTEEPFVDINCASLTPSLFESELFGYDPGAFTGGLNKGQQGKLDLAKGGTLFLDEVSEIPLELQAKFLRVLQEKEFYRVGGLRKIATDVRIICATNVDLYKKVEEGTFRRDLYYRLKVGHIIIPPLRQRGDEILPLATMFLEEFAKQKGKRFTRISDAAATLLNEYAWPGNVRELKNGIEWAVFMYDETELKPSHLGFIGQQNSKTGHDDMSLRVNTRLQINPFEFDLPAVNLPVEEFFNNIIIKALDMHGGNKTETALYLGISRRSLYSRLEKIFNKRMSE